jgi:hypothetical protein
MLSHCGSWNLKDCLFSFVGEGIPLLINHVPDVLNLGQAKFALGWVERDLVALEDVPSGFNAADAITKQTGGILSGCLPPAILTLSLAALLHLMSPLSHLILPSNLPFERGGVLV